MNQQENKSRNQWGFELFLRKCLWNTYLLKMGRTTKGEGRYNSLFFFWKLENSKGQRSCYQKGQPTYHLVFNLSWFWLFQYFEPSIFGTIFFSDLGFGGANIAIGRSTILMVWKPGKTGIFMGELLVSRKVYTQKKLNSGSKCFGFLCVCFLRFPVALKGLKSRQLTVSCGCFTYWPLGPTKVDVPFQANCQPKMR